jgi:hypothetical protein
VADAPDHAPLGDAPVSRETVSPNASPLKGLSRAGAAWTDVEELILMARARHGQRFAEIAAIRNRPINACRIKAHRMGIAKRYRRITPKRNPA